MEIGDMSSGGSTDIAIYIALALGVIEVAKRVAQLTPGKADDEIVGKIEMFVRKLIDLFAGNHGDAGDPGMIKPKEK